MHIPDGFLPPSIAIAGYAITSGVTWHSLRQINQTKSPQEKIHKASLLTAGFFVVSSIHIPIPPTSIHLVLNGLMGVVLGYYAFPAILIGLFFQAVMFQHGGLSTLGINAAMLGIPSILAYYIFQLRNWRGGQQQLIWTKVCAFIAGAGALGITAIIFTLITITTIPTDINFHQEQIAISTALGGYGIQAVIEGIFTVMLISFLQQVKPELLET